MSITGREARNARPGHVGMVATTAEPRPTDRGVLGVAGFAAPEEEAGRFLGTWGIFLATTTPQALHPDVTRSIRIGIAHAMQSVGAGVQFTVLAMDRHADRRLSHQLDTALAFWARAAFTRRKARGTFASVITEVTFRAAGGLVHPARTATEPLADKTPRTTILPVLRLAFTKFSLRAHTNQ